MKIRESSSVCLCLLTVSGMLAQDPIDARVAAIAARVSAAELERTVQDLAAFETRHVLSATDDPARGTGAARDYIEARLREIAATSDGRLEVTRHTATVAATRLRITQLPIVNLIATLRGSDDPERVYVVAGHYDSRNGDGADGEGAAPGANDDGSGTAVVIELARVFAAESLPATVVFACYDAEEQGLLGSEAHAAALAETGVQIGGMITNDIVGNTLGMDGVRRRDYLRCFSYAARGNDSLGRALARAATRAAERVDGVRVMLVQRGDRFGRGGDHRPFAQRGHPAVRFTEPREDFSRQHQNVTERDGRPYADLPEFIDYAYLADVARINASLLAELAAAPPMPTELTASGARDAYDTLLTWPPSPGAHAYEAVWRATTAPDWESAKLLGDDDITQARGRLSCRLVGVCIDDVVVGIRAVAKDGARSLVQTPPEPDAFGNRPISRDAR